MLLASKWAEVKDAKYPVMHKQPPPTRTYLVQISMPRQTASLKVQRFSVDLCSPSAPDLMLMTFGPIRI